MSSTSQLEPLEVSVVSDSEAPCLPRLPREILKQIVAIAVTSDDDAIVKMPCLTSALFQPGINTACLLLE